MHIVHQCYIKLPPNVQVCCFEGFVFIVRDEFEGILLPHIIQFIVLVREREEKESKLWLPRNVRV